MNVPRQHVFEIIKFIIALTFFYLLGVNETFSLLKFYFYFRSNFILYKE